MRDWLREERALRIHSRDRKSTRLNSSHLVISYAVFCLKKKKKTADKGCRKLELVQLRRRREEGVQRRKSFLSRLEADHHLLSQGGLVFSLYNSGIVPL